MSVEREITRRVAEQIYIAYAVIHLGEGEEDYAHYAEWAFESAKVWQEALELHKSQDPIEEETR